MSTKVAERTASLREAGSRIASREGKGARYLIRAMGWESGAEYVEGSSGRYPVAAIKRDFAEAYPAGTRMKANHDGFCEAGGDIRRIMGKTVGEWDFREDGAYTEIQVSPEWDGFMEDFADVIGISIAAGVEVQQRDEDDADEDEDDEDRRPIVERFLTQEESPYNSIDFVEAPGADGRIIQALESAKGHFEHVGMREAATFASLYLDQRRAQVSEAAPPRDSKEGIAMDEQQLAEAVRKAVADATPGIVEALKPAPAEPVTIRMEDVAESTFEAGLSKGSREAVYARVASGEAAEAAIAAEAAREKEIEERVKASLEAEQGHGGYAVGEGAAGTTTGLQAEWDSLQAEVI